MSDSFAAQPSQESDNEYRPPIRLVETDEEEFDALADLFLGDAESSQNSAPEAFPTPRPASADSSSEARARTSVEALILGHLPVSASAWVKSYAIMRARDLGSPVALLRVHSGSAVIELIDPASPSLHLDTLPSFDRAIQAAQSRTGHWILRVDDPIEPELCALPTLDAVTILSGADEAAVVATYRALKGLALDETSPTVQVAMMGSSEAESRLAWERIQRASAAFLPAPPILAGAMPQAASLPASLLYRGEAPASLSDTLARLVSGSVRGVRPVEPSADSTRLAINPAPMNGADRGDRASEPVAQSRPADNPTSEMHRLGEVCPDAQGVSFSLDGDGRLYLSSDYTPGATDQLLAARAWAERHATLLGRAYPQLNPGPITLELVAAHAADVTHLLRTGIRLKLRTTASVDGRPVSVVIDLN